MSAQEGTVPPEVPPHVIVEIRNIIMQTRIMVGVICGVFFWEWLTNLHAEYVYIWKARLSWLNIVFLTLRYYTFIALGLIAWVAFWEGSNVDQCKKMVLLLPYLPLVLFALANVIVIARVYAMYDKDLRVLGVLVALWIAEVTVQAYVPRNLEPLHLPPGIHACGPAFLGNAYLLYWVMIFVFDTVVLALSVIKLTCLWKANGIASKLVQVLFRDQIMFYALTFAANLTNILVYYAARDSMGSGRDLLSPVVAGITSMAICRVVLNLRRTAANDSEFSSSNRSRSRSNGVVGSTLLGPLTPTSGKVAITKPPPMDMLYGGDMEKQDKADMQDVLVDDFAERRYREMPVQLQPAPTRGTRAVRASEDTSRSDAEAH